MPAAHVLIADLHAHAKRLGGHCLSEAYLGYEKHHLWRCGKCTHEWQAAWNNVYTKGSWCPCCNNSLREELIRAVFQENFPGESFEKDRELIGMELDGFSDKLYLAFECDGEQHRERVPHFQRKEGAFEAQQARDAEKDTRCDRHYSHPNPRPASACP